MSKRPPIPEPVKRAAIILNMRQNRGKLICCETGDELHALDALNGLIHFDHRPALELRFRYEDGSYQPEANDLRFIDVCGARGHSIRTNKRRGLSPGDQTEIARSRKVRQATEEIAAMNERKAGRVTVETATLTNKVLKRTIPSRPFPKGKRPMRRQPA